MKYMGLEGYLECLSMFWFKSAGQLSVTGRVGNKRFYSGSDHMPFHGSGYLTLSVLMWENVPSYTVYIP